MTTPMPQLPPELISLIIHHLYLSLLPPKSPVPSPDPSLVLLPAPIPPSTPSSPSYSFPPRPKSNYGFFVNRPTRPPALTFSPPPVTVARTVLLPLCLVNKTWNEEATKCLWRSVGFGMPRGFEGIVRTVREYNETHAGALEGADGLNLANLKLEAAVARRGQRAEPSESEIEWAGMSGFSVRSYSEDACMSPTSLVPTPPNLSLIPSHSPLLYTYSISFTRFRTAGLRRSVSQGSSERFVTPERLLFLLRGTRLCTAPIIKPGEIEDSQDGADHELSKGRLEAVGFTEFMDSAITKEVLDELLLRGGYLATYSLPTAPSSPPIHDHSALKSYRPPSPPLHRGRERVLHAFRADRDLQSSRSPSRPIEDIDMGEDELMDEDEEEEGEEDDTIHEEAVSEEDEGEEEVRVGRQVRVRALAPSTLPPRAPSTQRARSLSTQRGLDQKRSLSIPRSPSGGRSPSLGRRPGGGLGVLGSPPSTTRGLELMGSPPATSGLGFMGSPPPTSMLATANRVRRSSGAAFAERAGRGPGRNRHSQTDGEEEEEERGRGRKTFPPAGTMQTTVGTRSSSVPAPFAGRQSTPVGVGVRSSSVPAIGREEVVVVKRELETRLEGTMNVRPIRALDLCGCISGRFVKAVGEMVREYRLGQGGEAKKEGEEGEGKEGEKEEDGGKKKL
ncbi:hypothetical protein P7C70_g8916, partial [Phenoliferia sp. Uapishka_3]